MTSRSMYFSLCLERSDCKDLAAHYTCMGLIDHAHGFTARIARLDAAIDGLAERIHNQTPKHLR